VLKLADWDYVSVSVDGIVFSRQGSVFVVHPDDIPRVLQYLKKYEKEGEIRYLSGNDEHTILEILTCEL
jgi:hypothetical protein